MCGLAFIGVHFSAVRVAGPGNQLSVCSDRPEAASISSQSCLWVVEKSKAVELSPRSARYPRRHGLHPQQHRHDVQETDREDAG